MLKNNPNPLSVESYPKTDDLLSVLSLLDPEFFRKISNRIGHKKNGVPKDQIALLVKETLWGIDQEISFGMAYGLGIASLAGDRSEEALECYRERVRKALQIGPTLANIVASYLPGVLTSGDEKLFNKFFNTLDVISKKGTHLIGVPFEALGELSARNDTQSAKIYLDLLLTVFSKDLSYTLSLNLANSIPKSVREFEPEQRFWQIKSLLNVAKRDVLLLEPYLEGCKGGLSLLSASALNRFVETAFSGKKYSRRNTATYLSLRSRIGLETYHKLQVKVSFSQMSNTINRYLQARTKSKLSARPISSLPKQFLVDLKKQPLVCTDGKWIYVADELGVYHSRNENKRLFKILVRMESSFCEFETFSFDMEKLIHNCGANLFHFNTELSPNVSDNLCDLQWFLSSFENKELVQDIFNIIEFGRIRVLTSAGYPGILRNSMPVFLSCFDQSDPSAANHMLFPMYAAVAWGVPLFEIPCENRSLFKVFSWALGRFQDKISSVPSVETSAELTLMAYTKIQELLAHADDTKAKLGSFYQTFGFPFGRKIFPELYQMQFGEAERISRQLKAILEGRGFSVYKSDILNFLKNGSANLSKSDIQAILSKRSQNSKTRLSDLDLEAIFGSNTQSEFLDITEEVGTIHWYKEWHHELADYLHNHVRVRDCSVSQNDDTTFYENTLIRHHGLVSHIRRAFEMMKPEGLKILKPWIEGDAFDYRALIDFAIEKKAGLLPSDRLYIKRLKQRRDVSVLLLVDISRSTANPVFNSVQTILEIEKESIVLFCEALEVLGDAFSIAGFSGSGRLGVDYYRIKDFDNPMDLTVKARIGAMTPHRSTRMGAAIRHATSILKKFTSKTRILILLGDGFPNDLEYKREYAIKDTRKAVSEAFAGGIFFKAITVNITGGSRLDDLYGNFHHTVISDVCQLPDRILRIYSDMTRC
jgi:hypothetical protein